MERLRRWMVRLLAGFGALVIVIIVLAVIIAAIFGDEGNNGDSSTAEAQASPTLTDAQRRHGDDTRAAATAQAATAEARAHALETREARPTYTPRSTATPVPPPYELALISGICTRRPDIGFIECEGFVKNLTTGPLENVMVVAIHTDGAGTPLASDDALIDYNPILAGQESPWSTIGPYNPAFTHFRIEFKDLFGGSILTRDDRQQ